MTQQIINDWKVVVGFDDSKVQNGAKRMERLLDRTAKKQAKAMGGMNSQAQTSRQSKLVGQKSKLIKTEEKARRSEIRKLKLQGKITRSQTKLSRLESRLDTKSLRQRRLAAVSAGRLQQAKSGDPIAFAKFNRNLAKLNGEISKNTQQSRRFTAAMRGAGGQTLNRAIGIGAGVAGAAVGVSEGVHRENLRVQFGARFGSVEGERHLDFLNREANRLGVSFTTMSEGFVKLANAMDLPQDRLRELSSSLAASTRALGLNAQDTATIFRVLRQTKDRLELVDSNSLEDAGFGRLLAAGGLDNIVQRVRSGEDISGERLQDAIIKGVEKLNFDQIAVANSNNVGGSLTIISNSFSNLADQLSILFLPITQLGTSVISGAVDGLTSFISWINSFEGTFVKMASSITLGLGGIVASFASAISGFEGLKALFESLKSGKSITASLSAGAKGLFQNFVKIGNALMSVGSRFIGMISGILRFLGVGIAGAATSSVGAATGGVVAAGATGFGVGTLIDKGLQAAPVDIGFRDALGEGIANTLAFFGNDEAQASIDRMVRFEAGNTSTINDNRSTVIEANFSIDGSGNPQETARVVREELSEVLRENNASLASF